MRGSQLATAIVRQLQARMVTVSVATSSMRAVSCQLSILGAPALCAVKSHSSATTFTSQQLSSRFIPVRGARTRRQVSEPPSIAAAVTESVSERESAALSPKPPEQPAESRQASSAVGRIAAGNGTSDTASRMYGIQQVEDAQSEPSDSPPSPEFNDQSSADIAPSEQLLLEHSLMTNIDMPPGRHPKVKSAVFVKSSSNVGQCPKSNLPEFAVIGRSNVGKSSLINMLTSRKALAQTSKKPGTRAAVLSIGTRAL